MQQLSSEPIVRSPHVQRSGITPTGAVQSTAAVSLAAIQKGGWPHMSHDKRPSYARHAMLLLLLWGFLLGFCYFLFYPLSWSALPGSAQASTLATTLPWLIQLFWTHWMPFLTSLLAHISWLDLRTGSSTAMSNLWLILSGVALGLLFLAARVCQRTLTEQLTSLQIHLLLGVICFFGVLFGILFLFLPGGNAQETLLYDLYGRLVATYHINPYLASSSVLTHDALFHALPDKVFTTPLVGPLWLDLTVPIAWLAGTNVSGVLLDFRAFGLLFQLANTLLIWLILSRLKPEMRLTGTLLYAWNPALLLLGIGEMHADIAAIFFVLLGTLFLQRRMLFVGWICQILAVLINPLCLLLLPLFLRTLAQEMEPMSRSKRTLWWIGLLCISTLVLTLAYAPYWPGLGLNGIAIHIGQVFWQAAAHASLLNSFSQLPFASWPPMAWLLTPFIWNSLLALAVCVLLVSGIWITDNLELALLFGSWSFLIIFALLPENVPWRILLPLTLAITSSNRRTIFLAHLLTLGALITYCLNLRAETWSGQALVTVGIPCLIWGWALFFLSTRRMTYRGHETTATTSQPRKRFGISRPPWPQHPSSSSHG